MNIEHEEGQSVYLRGWGDYQPYSLKLTEAPAAGLASLGLRARDPEALQRRAEGIEATGLGGGWTVGERARGRSYRFRDPDGHSFDLYDESEPFAPPPQLRPDLDPDQPTVVWTEAERRKGQA